MNDIDKSFFGKKLNEQIEIVKKELQPLNLIDQFFFIIYKLNENFEFHYDLHLIQNKILDIQRRDDFCSNHLFETFGENNYSEFLILKLKNIFKILKNRFIVDWLQKTQNFSILNNYDHLLISRYSYHNWKTFIKQELEIRLKKEESLGNLKRLIISSFEEIEYRTKLNYTWDIYQENLRSENSFDIESGPFFSRQTISTIEDIEWIKNLTEDDVKNQKIIIHRKASKQRLINGINKIINEGLLSKVKYSEKDKIEHKKEMKKFINYIIQKENEKPSYSNPQFNLNFITKPKEFYKIFYYCSLNDKENKEIRFIKSKKTDIAKIFEDTLNRSRNDGYSYSSLIRIVEEDDPKKIENGNKPKRPEDLLNHKFFKPIRDICRSEILNDFMD